MVGSQPCPKYSIKVEKHLTVASTLAYHEMAKVIAVKDFIVQAPGEKGK